MNDETQPAAPSSRGHRPPGSTPGRFIVLEGLDGSGTTTQAELLAGALQRRDLQVCLTREPSDGPLGLVARAHVRREVTLDPVTATLAFSADRADHLARVVRPALDAGRWVVCDRYLLSTLAYQGADGIDRDWILAVSAGFAVPDVAVFLDLPEAQRARRVATRGSVERYDDGGVQARVRAAYAASIDLLRAHGHLIEVVSSSGSVMETLQAVLSRVDSLPGSRLP